VERLLERLARLDGYPASFVDGYRRNVVSREDNVRAVLAKVELGEGDAAIVYATDVAASDDVIQIAIPTAANVVATYDAVVLAGGRSPHSRAFVDWLTGPAGSAVLADLGFGAVR
ncbi:MAG TPA: extracellular solute-binding protein, partial [Actinomycetota bacterium]